ncbi:MAG: FAD-dependent oxidoreductase [Bacilli bacterium]|nr:FAD-dependent oxidoreductase [Bacilli bacterium]
MSEKVFDCLIIGAGPCGISAGEVLIDKGLNVAIIECSTPGGKINIAPRVDNYPGKKEIPGPELAMFFFERLNNKKIPLIGDEVVSLEKQGNLFIVKCLNNTYESKSVVIASGTKERMLGLENENKLFGHGVSYCALCDGHFYKNKDVLVIGGGNAALKEAIYLAGIVKHLTLIHRRNEFRGNTKLVDELTEFKNTEVLTPYIPIKLNGGDSLESVEIQNLENNKVLKIKVDGVFPLVGQIPNTKFVKIPNVLNETGNVVVDKSFMTSVSGLFAGGDVLPRDIRQIYLSEHDGKIIGQNVIGFLEESK